MKQSPTATKRALGLSALSLLVCVAMLLGTTFAWFTDSVTSGVNKIVAGNLDIDVLANGLSIENQTTLFQTDNWEPGVISYQNFTVQNKGTLAAKIKFNLDVLDENRMTEGDYCLSQIIKVAYLEDTTFSGDRTAAQQLTYGDLTDQSSEFNLEANATKNIAVVLYWIPTDSDNNWNANNGKTTSDGKPLYINIAVNAVATHNTQEADSFDNQYDKNAVYPVLAALVDIEESYSGNFVQNKIYTEGTTESTQVTAKDNIQLANDSGVTLIPAGTTLYKANGPDDEPINTTDDNADGYAGSIVSNIKTTDSTADSVTYQISYSYKEGDTSTSVSKFSEIVTNVFDVSKGLKNVAVTTTHNGGDETSLNKLSSNSKTDKSFYYDSADGKLYVYSSEYSTFKFTYEYDFVGAVGGQGYATLAEAFAAAKAGDTITLLQDCETGSTYTMINPLALTAAKVTLDLNGKTITTTNNFSFAIAASNITVKNGTIKSGELRGTNNEYFRGYPLVVAALETGTKAENVAINNVTVYGGISAGGSKDNSTTTILGSAEVTLKDCTVLKGYAWTLYSQINSTLVVESGTYSKGQSGLASAESGSTISISGGSYETTDKISDKLVVCKTLKQNETTNYYDVQDLTAEDATASVTVGEDTKYYATMSQAFEAAKNGGTVTLLKNEQLQSTLICAANGNVAFDLNGKTWAPYNNVVGFKLQGGSWTVKSTSDGGEIKPSDATFYLESGNLTIESGTYATSSKDAIFAVETYTGNVTINGGTFGKLILKGGSIAINGGTFNGEIYKGNNATISITGGTFSIDPSAYVAEGYEATNSGDFWTVGKAPLKTVADIKTAVEAAKSGDTVTIAGGTYYFGDGLTIPEGVTIAKSGTDEVYLVVPVVYVGNENQQYKASNAPFNENKTDTYLYGFTITSTAYGESITVNQTDGDIRCSSSSGYYGTQTPVSVTGQTITTLSMIGIKHDDCTTGDDDVNLSVTVNGKQFTYTFDCKVQQPK